LKLANKGFYDAIGSDAGLKEGVNTYNGYCTYEAVASAQGIPFNSLDALITQKATA